MKLKVGPRARASSERRDFMKYPSRRPTAQLRCQSLTALTLVISTCICVAKPTRYKDKPPGWRPDQPSEGGGDVVDRMMRKIERYGVMPGTFFSEFEKAMTDLASNNELLRPVTLLPDGMSAPIDSEMRSSLKAAQASLEWQQRQMDYYEGFEASQGSKDPADWNHAALMTYLVACRVLENSELVKLTNARRVSLAKDLARLHRILIWTLDSMPDDEEAEEITRKKNKDLGYPPPSPRPPPPPKGPRDEL